MAMVGVNGFMIGLNFNFLGNKRIFWLLVTPRKQHLRWIKYFDNLLLKCLINQYALNYKT
jgi:hypothetical protein